MLAFGQLNFRAVDTQHQLPVRSKHLSRGDESPLLHVAHMSTWSCFKLLAPGPQHEALHPPGRLMGHRTHWGLPEAA
jgi:hypothetical protein